MQNLKQHKNEENLMNNLAIKMKYVIIKLLILIKMNESILNVLKVYNFQVIIIRINSFPIDLLL